MLRSKLLAIIVAATIGFVAGLVLRPIILPPSQTNSAVGAPSSAAGTPSDAPRGTQYFEANIGEARQVVAACRDGAARGDECTNAETAIITVESKERFKRFRTER